MHVCLIHELIHCRLEKLTLGSHAGKAKLVGTVVGIGGAMIFTFFQGPEFSGHLVN